MPQTRAASSRSSGREAAPGGAHARGLSTATTRGENGRSHATTPAGSRRRAEPARLRSPTTATSKPLRAPPTSTPAHTALRRAVEEVERERLHRVAEPDAAGLLHLAVDAEVDLALGVLAPVGLDQAQRVEVAVAGGRVAGRDRAAGDGAAQRDERRADAHAPADPRVLLVRLAAGEVDQHAEAPAVDLAGAGPAREL